MAYVVIVTLKESVPGSEISGWVLFTVFGKEILLTFDYSVHDC